MSEPSVPVLISCESADARTAVHIRDKLRSAGIEASIYEYQPERNDHPKEFEYQIERCAVFLPILSWDTFSRRATNWQLVDQLATKSNRPRIVMLYADRRMAA